MRSVLLPLNDKFVGPLERKADDRTPLPLVFVLGNHSSGKSTFIVRPFPLLHIIDSRATWREHRQRWLDYYIGRS